MASGANWFEALMKFKLCIASCVEKDSSEMIVFFMIYQT
jgi:hypothetical protein